MTLEKLSKRSVSLSYGSISVNFKLSPKLIPKFSINFEIRTGGADRY